MTEIRTRTRQTYAEQSVSRHAYSRFRSPDAEWSEWRESRYWRIDGVAQFNPRTSTCNDYSGRYDADNELDISHEARKMGQVDAYHAYTQQSAGLESEYYSTCSLALNPNHYGMDSMDLNEDRIRFATQAAAGVNPSKAHVDLAVFIGELRDLPSLFENTGRSLMKYGGNRYLQYQYGWKPLVKDLRSFFEVVNRVDRRMRTLERLSKGKVLKLPYRNKNPLKTSGLNAGEFEQECLPNARAIISASTEWTFDRWATVYFKPEVPDNLVTLPGSSMLAKANAALYGGVVDGSTLWNLMPWSWLYDWTSNVGTFLSANRNVVGAKVTTVTVMETSTLSTRQELRGFRTSEGISAPQSSQLPAFLQTVSKKRFPEIVPSVTSAGKVDLLHDTFKTSILTALAIQRLKSI